MPNWPTSNAWPSQRNWPAGNSWPSSNSWPADFSGNFASLFPGAYQVVQTDRGLTYGGTMLATGTAPPVVGLTGSTTAMPKPIRITTTAGALGVATYALSLDGGATTAQSGATAASVPIALLPGLSATFAALPAFIGDEVYLATCAALADQSGNVLDYSQVAGGSQPLITVGLNGIAGIANPTIGAAKFMSSPFAMPSTTTPMMCLAVCRALSWTVNARLLGDATNANHCAILQLNGASPALMQYDSVAGNVSTDLAINAFGAVEAKWNNSTADYIRCGSGTAQTGISCSNAGAGTGRQLFATLSVNFGAYEVLAVIHTPPVSSAAFRAAVASKYGGAVAV